VRILNLEPQHSYWPPLEGVLTCFPCRRGLWPRTLSQFARLQGFEKLFLVRAGIYRIHHVPRQAAVQHSSVSAARSRAIPSLRWKL